MGGDIKVEITWYSGNGRDISFRQQSIKEGLQKIDRQLTAKGKGGGNHKNDREPWGGGGGGKGKCYHETTKFPHPTPTRGLNNDRFLNKVTKREGS